MCGISLLLISLAAVITALPTDHVITKLNPDGLRYGYVRADDGTPHLIDSWVKTSDLLQARYNPDIDNEYHLFTRSNPSVSQPMLENNGAMLAASHYDPSKQTIVLIHGFMGTTVSAFNTVLVPAILAADDVNIIVVDWGRGAFWGLNGISSGRSVGRVLRWISTSSGSNLADFHLLGYSVGAHQAGIVGRTLSGEVGYITAMDPANRWPSSNLFRSDDAQYTEVIHTNAGNIGVAAPLGDVDFYPNGGSSQPGCLTPLCAHYRSYYFMAESLSTGGFVGRECPSHLDAIGHSCNGANTLEMGGLRPKTGKTGVYYLSTNAAPPFARGNIIN